MNVMNERMSERIYWCYFFDERASDFAILTNALPTDRPTDRPTDQRTQPIIEMRGRILKGSAINEQGETAKRV